MPEQVIERVFGDIGFIHFTQSVRKQAMNPMIVLRWFTITLLCIFMVIGRVKVGNSAQFHCASGDVDCLISSIETANTNGQTNTITLEAGTYTLITVNNDTEGSNGLPSITSTLQIIGDGAATTIIEREEDAPSFRLFHSAEGGVLTLDQLTVQGGDLSRDSSFPNGGGIYNQGTLTVTNSVITNNFGNTGSAGGLYNTGTATISQTRITHNTAWDVGGGIVNLGSISISQSTIAENEVQFGPVGGIVNSGLATITESTISKNGGEGPCGIANNGDMTLSKSFISSNCSGISSLSGQISNNGKLIVLNSTITISDGGIATHGGGTNPSLTRIINSTVTAHGTGSLIWSAISGPVNADEGTVEVENTIVAGNDNDCTGHVTSLGFNLVGDPTRCSMVLVSSDEIGDPGLGALSDDGTPGNGHYPLLKDSKAVDGGNNAVCPPTDQLGHPRPLDGDNNGTKDCDIGAFEFQPTMSNQAPVVHAGGAQTITLPNVANLSGSVTDDGLPNPPALVTTTWSKVSGSGTVSFAHPNSLNTSASFSLPGTYSLRLTADDSALQNSAEVIITVNPPLPVNQAPMVNAGPAQTIILPNAANLNGTVTDDGLPNPPGRVTTVWSKVSGLGVVTFGDQNAVKTTANFSSLGTYVLRLTATDGALATSGTVTITVRSSGAKKQPTDLNGDGTADLLWRNTKTTVVAGWLTNGLDIASSGFLGGVPAEWEIKGIGDVDGDGKADVVWKHSRLHVVAIWLMNGLTISGVGFPGGVSAEWEIEGVGDLDGNGTADLVWRNSSGVVAVWLMNGTTFTKAGFLGGVPAQWQIKGVGDVNADGKADIIWRHSTSGTVAVWVMNGLTRTSVGFPGSASMNWTIDGVGDVDGNGTADLVWHNTATDSTAIWLMNGTRIAFSGFPGALSTEWHIAQVGDTDGDGKADIVLRNNLTSGVDVWLMDGLSIATTGSLGATPTDWEIQ